MNIKAKVGISNVLSSKDQVGKSLISTPGTTKVSTSAADELCKGPFLIYHIDMKRKMSKYRNIDGC